MPCRPLCKEQQVRDTPALLFPITAAVGSCCSHDTRAFPAGLRVLDIRLDSQSVLVETSMDAGKVKGLLESTGRRAVLKGMGSTAPREYGVPGL